MVNILKVRGLTKSYEDHTVLDNVEFELKQNEIMLIKGRSGTGKSTLLNICSMLENPDAGEIIFDGKNLDSYDHKEKQDILRNHLGYIFQDYNLFEDLTVYDNLYIYLTLSSDLNKSKINELIRNSLDEVGLLSKIKSKAKLLSGGERQRVALARTLLLPRKLVFADEPTANIDEENSAKLINIFNKLKDKNTAIIIVSHDDIFDSLADKIYLLEGGKLCQK